MTTPRPTESISRPRRHYVEFADPACEQVIRADLTWLTSSWHCIFGAGCPGILASLPHAGCCALGAHFTDDDDVARVEAVVARLSPATWQRHGTPAAEEWLAHDEDGERTTASTPGGCVFLNGSGFAGGVGCALHLQALREGTEPWRYKPDVCWQLPIRRAYRTVARPDGSEYLELCLEEYDRRAWGPGGADLDWYCTASPAALGASAPLYRSAASELTELIGAPAYAVLREECEHYQRAHR